MAEIEDTENIAPGEAKLPEELQKRLDFHKKRSFPEGTRFEWVPLSQGFPAGFESKSRRGKKSGLRFLDSVRLTPGGRVTQDDNGSELYQLFAIVPPQE